MRAISATACATSSACAADSIWQGPAMSTSGRSLAISIAPTRTVLVAFVTG